MRFLFSRTTNKMAGVFTVEENAWSASAVVTEESWTDVEEASLLLSASLVELKYWDASLGGERGVLEGLRRGAGGVALLREVDEEGGASEEEDDDEELLAVLRSGGAGGTSAAAADVNSGAEEVSSPRHFHRQANDAHTPPIQVEISPVNLVGLLGPSQSDVFPDAIAQWTRELTTACAVPRNSPNAFSVAFKKRGVAQVCLCLLCVSCVVLCCVVLCCVCVCVWLVCVCALLSKQNEHHRQCFTRRACRHTLFGCAVRLKQLRTR